MSKTGNWKGAERFVASVYQKYKIPATRISRAGNFAESTYDVDIEGHPEIKTDSKYSKQNFRHHGKLETIRFKYCKSRGDIPVLSTKNYKERGSVFSVEDEFFSMLLSYWLGFGTKEELLAIYNKDE